jgi:hypothetical protein
MKSFAKPETVVLKQHFERKLVELEEEKKMLQVLFLTKFHLKWFSSFLQIFLNYSARLVFSVPIKLGKVDGFFPTVPTLLSIEKWQLDFSQISSLEFRSLEASGFDSFCG